jgi:cobalt/nickel transport system permease protein
MHIPDGYISPRTFVPAWLIFTPLIIHAFKKVKKVLDEQTLPLISSLAALSFVIMMFNIPVPGGTSGHAIGAAVIAILFDPWVAFLSISIVLLIQALVFGDGGITTYAINALSMGFIASFTGFYTYNALKKRIPEKINYFISGWFSIVLASFFVAVLLGIQPAIASDASGHPLYFPFGLRISIPALVGAHALFFGVVEGLFTLFTVTYIRKVYQTQTLQMRDIHSKNDIFVFLSGLAVLILLVPLGLLTGNPAWGEWDSGFFKEKLGAIPHGIQKLSEIYFAPVKDYSLQGLSSVESYYLSAFVGVMTILLLFFLFTGKRSRKDSANLQKMMFVVYFIALMLVAFSNNIYFIGLLLLSALLLSGKLIFKLLKRTLLILFLVNFVISAFYVYLATVSHTLSDYSLIVFNLRSFTLLYFTFLMLHKVNVFTVFSFSRTLSFLLILSYSQILAFRQTFFEFSMAYKSKTIVKPTVRELHKFIANTMVFFIRSAISNSTEILLALKSRNITL